jgi:hypothetical protein
MGYQRSPPCAFPWQSPNGQATTRRGPGAVLEGASERLLVRTRGASCAIPTLLNEVVSGWGKMVTISPRIEGIRGLDLDPPQLGNVPKEPDPIFFLRSSNVEVQPMR